MQIVNNSSVFVHTENCKWIICSVPCWNGNVVVCTVQSKLNVKIKCFLLHTFFGQCDFEIYYTLLCPFAWEMGLSLYACRVQPFQWAIKHVFVYVYDGNNVELGKIELKTHVDTMWKKNEYMWKWARAPISKFMDTSGTILMINRTVLFEIPIINYNVANVCSFIFRC